MSVQLWHCDLDQSFIFECSNGRYCMSVLSLGYCFDRRRFCVVLRAIILSIDNIRCCDSRYFMIVLGPLRDKLWFPQYTCILTCFVYDFEYFRYSGLSRLGCPYKTCKHLNWFRMLYAPRLVSNSSVNIAYYQWYSMSRRPCTPKQSLIVRIFSVILNYSFPTGNTRHKFVNRHSNIIDLPSNWRVSMR